MVRAKCNYCGVWIDNVELHEIFYHYHNNTQSTSAGCSAKSNEPFTFAVSTSAAPGKEWAERIHRMFLSGDGSDCTIECGTQQFSVHKNMLMAHSAVFRAMFSHKETVESKESRIRITDCAPAAVHQMLTYMYSGGLPDNFDIDHAQGLIEIAEKYGLDSLKTICQDKLIERLNWSNVCAMLMVADMHNADKLMSACIPLVKSHIHVLLVSPEWAQMESTNPGLVIAILKKVVVTVEPPKPNNSSQSHPLGQNLGRHAPTLFGFGSLQNFGSPPVPIYQGGLFGIAANKSSQN